MSRLDTCHHQVVRTLKKVEWMVNDIPLRVDTTERYVYIDIEAWRQANGSTLQIMLAEVKCFLDRNSTTTELYGAFGQFIIYRAILAEVGISAPLYLVIPDDIYQDVFDTVIRRAVADNHVKLLIVNLETETIVEWIE